MDVSRRSLDSRSTSFKCGQCGQVYLRKEHLQRHLNTHSDDRPHQCHQCKAAFQRSDVLARHLKTCTGKRAKSSSTSKRACLPCARAKRACDASQPVCTNCLRKDVECRYPEALVGDVQDSADSTLKNTCRDTFSYGLGNVDDWHDLIQCNIESRSSNYETSLRFLERFTRTNGLVSSFDCLSECERLVARAAFVSGVQEQGTHQEPLWKKCEEIAGLVEEVVRIKPRNSAVSLEWLPDLRIQLRAFFSSDRLRLYLEMFWAFWHPNVNFMHRASFDIKRAKPGLVAAMAVMGASVSPEGADRDDAATWYTAVEEIVFQDDDFCRDYENEAHLFPSSGRMQSLQAAYIVCLYQNWEGSDLSKRRTRRFRFTTMVAVARDIGLVHATHLTSTSAERSSFSWSDFIMREELIRVFLWIFLLDTAFVIFNNLPPRMAIKEMIMQLATNEAAFQASTSDECFQHLTQGSQKMIHTLSSLCERLCSDPMEPELLASLADLGPLNLFALTSALHSLSFQIQQCFGYDRQMIPIRTALDNWILIWQIYSDQYASTARHDPMYGQVLTSSTMWKRVGFSRYAYEYWTLAKLIVDRIAITAYLDDDDATPGSLLRKYDDTSMKQVNDLISEFQKIGI